MTHHHRTRTTLAAITLGAAALTIGAATANAQPLPLTPVTSDVTGTTAPGTSPSGTFANGSAASAVNIFVGESYFPPLWPTSLLPDSFKTGSYADATLSQATGLVRCGNFGDLALGCVPNFTLS